MNIALILLIPLALLGISKLVDIIMPEDTEKRKLMTAYELGYKEGAREGHRNANIILQYAMEFIHKDRERLTEYQEAPQLLQEEIEDSFSYWLDTHGERLLKK